ncbi:MAG: hypothetical protein WCC32_12060 [Terriglobales bacterium]
MIPVIIVAAVMALSLSVFLAWQLLERHRGDAELTPVDLEAFENLTDPEEEHFLRTNLSPTEFRSVQRGRIRAARLYLAALSQNAAVLEAVGKNACSSSDSEIAAAGQELVQRANHLTNSCLFSRLCMEAAFVLPAQISLSGKIVNQYMLVTYMAANLPRSRRIATNPA